MTALKRTAFFDIHQKLGAKIVPFAGYEMPVQYPQGITAEHTAVRTTCGLFDVSHMGEFMVRGPQALEFVSYVTTNDVAALAIGQVHYSTILNERGTIEDDCLVYRFADHLMMVVNASNAAKDFAHISKYLPKFKATLEDVSDDMSLLALQGPESSVDSAAHDEDRFVVDQVLPLRRGPGGWSADRSSRGPGTREKTVSSSTSTTGTPNRCGAR